MLAKPELRVFSWNVQRGWPRVSQLASHRTISCLHNGAPERKRFLKRAVGHAHLLRAPDTNQAPAL